MKTVKFSLQFFVLLDFSEVNKQKKKKKFIQNFLNSTPEYDMQNYFSILVYPVSQILYSTVWSSSIL